jgi:hypothetical protein
MRKIPFWRYLAVTRKTLFAASICALLVFSLGCGNTNKLQSITLTAALINGVAPTGQSGFVTLQGNGGTIQLLATGMYTNGKTKDLTGVVTYTAIVDPNYSQTDYGAALLPHRVTAQFRVNRPLPTGPWNLAKPVCSPPWNPLCAPG